MSGDDSRTIARWTDLWHFYLLALALSWAAWLPLVAGRFGWIAPQPAWLHLLGSLGPALAAIAMAHFRGGAADLFAGLSLRRLSLSGMAVALLLPALIGLAGLAVQAWTHGVAVDLGRVLTSDEFPGLTPIGLILSSLVFYGFGEEIGWRGYLLPRLLTRMGAFPAALIVTLPWAIWHLPLLVSSPTYQSLGLAGLFGWLVSLLTGSFLMTWLFLAFGRSLVAVALFHATLDLAMANPVTEPLGLNVMGALVTLTGVWAARWAWRSSRERRGERAPER